MIDAERDWLNDRIARRFDIMLAEGALEEARANLPRWDRAGGARKAPAAKAKAAAPKAKAPAPKAKAPRAKVAKPRPARAARTSGQGDTDPYQAAPRVWPD